jgi:hypothetical protein
MLKCCFQFGLGRLADSAAAAQAAGGLRQKRQDSNKDSFARAARLKQSRLTPRAARLKKIFFAEGRETPYKRLRLLKRSVSQGAARLKKIFFAEGRETP